jgi:hypothetical protein
VEEVVVLEVEVLVEPAAVVAPVVVEVEEVAVEGVVVLAAPVVVEVEEVAVEGVVVLAAPVVVAVEVEVGAVVVAEEEEPLGLAKLELARSARSFR